MEEPVLSIRDLSKSYTRGGQVLPVLTGVSLDIPAGAFLALMGPSGSGKSTLLNCIAGIDRVDAGSILHRGEDVTRLSESRLAAWRAANVGFIFQSYYLVPSLTAEENVALALTFQGTFGQDARRRADEALERGGLKQRAAHRPSQLSGGEQQRVAIARAIVHRPPLLLADEPTGNLDRATARDVVALLSEIHSTMGTTIVMVTHDEEMAKGVAGRVLRLRDGRLIDPTEGSR